MTLDHLLLSYLTQKAVGWAACVAVKWTADLLQKNSSFFCSILQSWTEVAACVNTFKKNSQNVVLIRLWINCTTYVKQSVAKVFGRHWRSVFVSFLIGIFCFKNPLALSFLRFTCEADGGCRMQTGNRHNNHISAESLCFPTHLLVSTTNKLWIFSDVFKISFVFF